MRLRRVALLVCLLVASAGCLGTAAGPLHPPSGPVDEAVASPGGAPGPPGDGRVDTDGGSAPGIDLPAYEFEEGTAGNVVVELTVRNNGSETRNVRLVAGIEIGGSIEQRSKVVRIDPGQRTIVGIQFDATWEQFTPSLAYARADRV